MLIQIIFRLISFYESDEQFHFFFAYSPRIPNTLFRCSLNTIFRKINDVWIHVMEWCTVKTMINSQDKTAFKMNETSHQAKSAQKNALEFSFLFYFFLSCFFAASENERFNKNNKNFGRFLLSCHIMINKFVYTLPVMKMIN